ncbi:hypothetical protein VXR01_11225, partial [Acinetobacter baumannii]|uniref:hypothetical protein n=1 Tax=Acinetobacter baumannii TaxID=470 RepID=UPI003A8357E9
VWCGNSTDGSSPLIFQVNFLSAIRVNLTIEDLNFQQKMCKDYFVNKCFGSSCYIFLVFSMHVLLGLIVYI